LLAVDGALPVLGHDRNFLGFGHASLPATDPFSGSDAERKSTHSVFIDLSFLFDWEEGHEKAQGSCVGDGSGHQLVWPCSSTGKSILI
jgi:hypothetical protein